MGYLPDPRDLLYDKGYGLLCFTENMHKSFRIKYVLTKQKHHQRLHSKLFSKGNLKNPAETGGDLVGNKIAKTVSETTHEDPSKQKRTAKVDEALIQPIEIPKEKYVPPEKRQHITDKR